MPDPRFGPPIFIDHPTDHNIYLVCCRVAEGDFFCSPDNKISRCAKCGAGIFHRPLVPLGAIKICDSCALALAKEGNPP